MRAMRKKRRTLQQAMNSFDKAWGQFCATINEPEHRRGDTLAEYTNRFLDEEFRIDATSDHCKYLLEELSVIGLSYWIADPFSGDSGIYTLIDEKARSAGYAGLCVSYAKSLDPTFEEVDRLFGEHRAKQTTGLTAPEFLRHLRTLHRPIDEDRLRFHSVKCKEIEEQTGRGLILVDSGEILFFIALQDSRFGGFNTQFWEQLPKELWKQLSQYWMALLKTSQHARSWHFKSVNSLRRLQEAVEYFWREFIISDKETFLAEHALFPIPPYMALCSKLDSGSKTHDVQHVVIPVFESISTPMKIPSLQITTGIMCAALVTVQWRKPTSQLARDLDVFLTRIGELIVDLEFINRTVQMGYHGKGFDEATKVATHDIKNTVIQMNHWICDSDSLFDFGPPSFDAKVEDNLLGRVHLNSDLVHLDSNDIGVVLFPDLFRSGLRTIQSWMMTTNPTDLPFYDSKTNQLPSDLLSLAISCQMIALDGLLFLPIQKSKLTHMTVTDIKRIMVALRSSIGGVVTIDNQGLFTSLMWDEAHRKTLVWLSRVLLLLMREAIEYGMWGAPVTIEVLASDESSPRRCKWKVSNMVAGEGTKTDAIRSIIGTSFHTGIDSGLLDSVTKVLCKSETNRRETSLLDINFHGRDSLRFLLSQISDDSQVLPTEHNRNDQYSVEIEFPWRT